MKSLILTMMGLVAVTVRAEATATVDAVTQNWPWDNRVKIAWTLSGATAKCDVSAVRVSSGPAEVALDLTALRGDLSGLANGTHELVWSPSQDESVRPWTNLVNATFAVDVTASANPEMPEFLVVDLTSGKDAATWPVAGVESLDPTADEYKTTKLVLKRIRPAAFTAGSPTSEPCRSSTTEASVDVTLTNDYYIGVYELTQRQYELMTGTAGASKQGGAYPCYSFSWGSVRGTSGTAGARWPQSSAVTEGSLMHTLRTKAALPSGVPSGWKFDLPTNAQWEWACRGGTTSAWNDGSEVNVVTTLVANANGSVTTNCTDAALDRLGWYAGNSGGSVHPVGLKAPNRFGLYDMHGNVWEMCLDVIYYANSPGAGTEPRGGGYNTLSGEGDALYDTYGASYHVARGGSYKLAATTYYSTDDPAMAVGICRTATRCRIYSSEDNYVGCRICVRYSGDNE